MACIEAPHCGERVLPSVEQAASVGHLGGHIEANPRSPEKISALFHASDRLTIMYEGPFEISHLPVDTGDSGVRDCNVARGVRWREFKGLNVVAQRLVPMANEFGTWPPGLTGFLEPLLRNMSELPDAAPSRKVVAPAAETEAAAVPELRLAKIADPSHVFIRVAQSKSGASLTLGVPDTSK
jgi:hypothetical protein